nr:hypothetical protein [uncultured Gellertiella sp.]
MTLTPTNYGSDPTVESSSSALSWGPVLAGALAATVLTILLMLTGSALGLTMVSPWAGQGSTLVTLGLSAAIWLVMIQWLSAGVGGYLTGRLRTRWVGIHTDEIYFRDTAHGFLAWALATVLMVTVVASAATGLLQKGANATGMAVGEAAAMGVSATATSGMQPMDDITDRIMRPADPAATGTANPQDQSRASAEIAHILLHSAGAGKISDEDRTYLDRLVAARTGLTQADARARIETVLKQADDAKAEARKVADTARKATATATLLGALSLFIGAFIASAAAALGGRQRDDDESRQGLVT